MPTKKKFFTGNIARAYISTTFNNTIITLTDEKGDTLLWSSAGSCGFKGTKKGTAYAAQKAAEVLAKKAKGIGVSNVAVFVKGPGPGRELAIRTLQATGLNVISIKDITPIPHNGCRLRKRRRV